VPPWRSESSGTTASLKAIWGPPGGGVYVVGGSTVFHETNGDGIWENQDIVGARPLLAIWGSSPTDIYVAPNFEHSTGDGAWNPFTSNESGACATSLWGTGAANFYAANACVGATAVSHWKGASWVDEGPAGADVYTVWGSGPGDVYAGGDNLYHSTGDGTWTTQLSSASIIDSIWGSSSADVYAVDGVGKIYHSTGNGSWSQQKSGTTYRLFGVWGSSATDVYAVGQGGTILHSTGDGNWVQQPSGTSDILFAVWGTGPGDVYVVGENGIILHHP
jgi:hypothetical protein